MQIPNSTSNSNSHGLNRTIKRLLNEFKELSNHLPDNIIVRFNEDRILEWHFLFKGLKDTPFDGGEYHGVIVFPENYPFSPPSIRFITPNGRFKTNERVCFALSDFHPECWKPAYTVSVVLQGVHSFMMSETTDTVGSLNMDKDGIQSLAEKSREFNINNKVYQKMFEEDIHEIIKHLLNNSHTQAKRKEIISTDFHLKKSEIIECSPKEFWRGIQSANSVLNSPILKENRIKLTHLNQVSILDMTTKAKQQSKFGEIKQIARTSIDASKNRLSKGNISESSRGNQRIEHTLDNILDSEKESLIMDLNSSERFPVNQRCITRRKNYLDLDQNFSPHTLDGTCRHSVWENENDPPFNIKKSYGSDDTLFPFSQSLRDAKDNNQSREMILMTDSIPHSYSSKAYYSPSCPLINYWIQKHPL